MQSVIYAIINIANDKHYVGQASNKDKRFKEHIKTLKGQYHCNALLQRAWNKYGPTVFIFMVLERCEIKNLNSREQYWIDALKPAYNLAPVAGSMLNYKHTEEARANMAKAHLGQKHSEEFKENMSDRLKGNRFAAGRKHDQKQIEARMKSIRGIPKSAEHKAKIAAGNRGKIISEETRRKMSEAAKNRKKHIDENLKISSILVNPSLSG